MKCLSPTLSLIALLGIVSIGLSGCKTDTQGVTSNYAQQWTEVGGDVEDVTATAEDVLNDLALRDVESQSTRVDGIVTAETADGTEVEVNINPISDDLSEVTVWAGAVGDPDLGQRILDEIMAEYEDE